MAMYQWRKINFFEDRTPAGPVVDELKEDLTCSTSGRGHVAFGAPEGRVHVFDRGLKLLYSFQAHKGSVLKMKILKQRNMLVTVGEEEDGASSRLASTTLKLWDFVRLPAQQQSTGSGVLACLRSLRLFAQKFPESRVTCMTILEEAPPSLLIAIGLESGLVYTLRGDVARDKFVRARLAVDPPLEGGPASPVTGLGLRLEDRAVHLFVTTMVSTNEFDLSMTPPVKHVLDLHGCEYNCATMSDSQELVLGRPEAFYFYSPDGRGPCRAFEGKKQRVEWFRGYLVALTAEAGRPDQTVFKVYDLKNKLIAYSAEANDIAHVICEWGSIITLTHDAKLKVIAEKDMVSKLDSLFRKNLYTVAINLVQAHQVDPAAAADVMRKYGDHLYEKQDYDEAMAQYIRTIGQLEPSYVIQKFLDAQRTHNLTRYLETLHNKGLATTDHTTLLLNCYTKLKDVDKLDEFIRGGEDHRFDVETAVKVCRAAGYYEHALFVAKRAEEHDWYIKILVEDLGRYDEALKYIAGLSTYEAASTLKQYGKLLVRHKPGDTRAEVLKLCLGSEASKAVEAGAKPKPSSTQSQASTLPNPMDFADIFVDRPLFLMMLLEQYTAAVKDSPAQAEMLNTLLELYLMEELRAPVGRQQKVIAARLAAVGATPDAGTATSPGAAAAPMKTATAGAPPDSDSDAVEAEERRREQEGRRAKALTLLRNYWGPREQRPNYDADLALVLCQLHGFRAGQLFLYERTKLYKEILAIYMQDSDYESLINACKRLGDSSKGGDPSLWVDVLSYFGDSEEDFSKEVREVLQHIERDQLLPPLLVLQTLAKNPKLTLAVVKDYIARQMAADTKLIDEDRQAIDKYQAETASMRREVQQLKSTAQIFQANRCSSCTFALDLPAVHFLCMHSFHQRCLGDNENECPMCAPANRTVLDMKRDLDRSAHDHDKFFQLVQNSNDGFSVIAEYFGRGILNKPPPG